MIVVLSVLGAARMDSQPVEDAFFDRDAPAWKATTEAARSFGGDPVVVVADGPLAETLTPENLNRLLLLEACLDGQIRKGQGEFARICRRLAALDPVKVFAGPATFLSEAAAGINRVYRQQLGKLTGTPRTPREVVERQRQLRLGAEVIARYGLTSIPSLDNQDFVDRVVYGSGGRRSGPKPRLSYLFPSRDAAQIVLRLRSDLGGEDRSETVDLIRRATADPSVRLDRVSYVVSGSPVVFERLGNSLQSGVLLLAAVALLLMTVTLALVFASAWRLLPLAAALAGLAVSAGILWLTGGRFSLAALGAAPILAGLTVDYAVQIQARLDETDSATDPVEAIRETVRLGLPMIALACVATAFGFGALTVSSLPLVSEFGVMLAAGILTCFAVTFLLGTAALGLRGRRRDRTSPLESAGVMSGLRRRVKPVIAISIRAPARLVLVGLLIAVCGWAVSTRSVAGTEISQLLPTRSPAVQDLLEVERVTGSSGSIDLVVRAPDVTAPEVVNWIGEIRGVILRRGGYLPARSGGRPSCEGADLCPGPAITDFVGPGGPGRTAADNRDVLLGLPLSERRAMIAGGLKPGTPAKVTNVPFAIRTGSVERQADTVAMIEKVISESRGGKGPPPGVTATTTGLPVVITASMNSLAGSRYLLTGLALALIAIVLLIAFRSPRRMLVPMLPIVVAAGWSALVVSALELPLNPLSAVLSVLVIAIAAEFSLILTGRFRQERARGAGLAEALRLSYGRTGIAVATSGLTAIAGFAALAASDIGMLREFGLIAVVDLTVALAGVALVLPGALVWLERE
ncbi:MAG: MMPL family transporter [Solirubrobacterales bacterium]|nr:MMPL family transporter [Solirubrobacterales bacterium]